MPKDGKLTHEEMVEIINSGGSVIINGERVDQIGTLPTPAQVAVGLDPEAVEAEQERLEAQIKALQEQQAELKKAATAAKKENAELAKGQEAAEKSAEANAKEVEAEARAELTARHEADVQAREAAAKVEAERIGKGK